MRIDGHPKPYFLSYRVRHEEEFRLEAKFGALTVDGVETRRSAFCDVRVGSYRNDQVRSGGLRDNSVEVESYHMVRLPFSGDGEGIRHALWRLTEARYREAIDDLLHRRAMELSYLDEHRSLAAFERREPIEDFAYRRLPIPDMDRLRAFVRKASASFRRHPLLRDGAVRFFALNTYQIFVSSEGTTIVQCTPYLTLELYAWFLSPEGHGIPHTRSFFVRDPSELPTLEQLRREIRAMYRKLEALAKAPVIRSFSGPVLLDPRPAGLLMHEALGHRLEGNRLLSSGEGQTFRDAIGNRILPEGIHVYDDPSLERFEGRSLVGHYAYDDEGVPAQRAELIEDGVLQGFLTSRTPIAKKHRSNGHGRSAYHARPISRMAVTVVEAEGGLGD
ncbi:MAG: metallopeptidase TldD-related protein, partial [Myxococcales bacterium]|nr:metallopeptidase TldD-related protein [Myxococcales bacterium]